jgi:ArsR family transcriptional regulator, virulence genes transcriptional regulator
MDVNERMEIYRLHAEFCKTLSDANRLLIISELSRNELSVNELTQRLGLQQSSVSKHLALMRDNGLVNTRREGASIYYSLSDPRIFEAISLLRAVQSGVLEKKRKLSRSNPEFEDSKDKEKENANL